MRTHTHARVCARSESSITWFSLLTQRALYFPFRSSCGNLPLQLFVLLCCQRDAKRRNLQPFLNLLFLVYTDDFPKPQITVQPETQSALKGSNVTFICSAASSSDSPMTFAWKKDNEVLNKAEIHNQAHLRIQAGAGGDTEVTEYTTTLQLHTVDFSSEGKYQCVISNHFGSSYSTKARLTVNSKREQNLGGVFHECVGVDGFPSRLQCCRRLRRRRWT